MIAGPIALVAVASIILALKPTAAAADAPRVRPAGERHSIQVAGHGISTPLTADESSDIHEVSVSTGLDEERTRAKHHGIDAFDALATDLGQKSPDSFVLASLADDRHPTNWLLLKDRPDDATLARLSELGTDTEVVYGAPASFEELDRVSAAFVRRLTDESSAFTRVTTDIATEADRILVKYATDGSLTEEQLTALVDDALRYAASRSDDGLLPVPFDLEKTDATVFPEEVVKGGRGVTLPRIGHRPGWH